MNTILSGIDERSENMAHCIMEKSLMSTADLSLTQTRAFEKFGLDW
jgi:hypothetical protein